jgi:hypothetical protein
MYVSMLSWGTVKYKHFFTSLTCPPNTHVYQPVFYSKNLNYQDDTQLHLISISKIDILDLFSYEIPKYVLNYVYMHLYVCKYVFMYVCMCMYVHYVRVYFYWFILHAPLLYSNTTYNGVSLHHFHISTQYQLKLHILYVKWLN